MEQVVCSKHRWRKSPGSTRAKVRTVLHSLSYSGAHADCVISLATLFCSKALASRAGVQVQLESTGSVTVSWCGSSHAALASAGPVSVQDLQPLVVHSVESMHTSRLALCSEQQPLTICCHACSNRCLSFPGSALERKMEQGKLTVSPYCT